MTITISHICYDGSMNDLSPYDFDQTDSGWPALDRQGKYLEAAEAIEAYIAANQALIQSQKEVSLQTLHFHAGQEYAMADEYEKAIEHMKRAYKDRPDWDVYVDGTIAFLAADSTRLKEASTHLQRLAEEDQRLRANARLLADFLRALPADQTYADVYG